MIGGLPSSNNKARVLGPFARSVSFVSFVPFCSICPCMPRFSRQEFEQKETEGTKEKRKSVFFDLVCSRFPAGAWERGMCLSAARLVCLASL